MTDAHKTIRKDSILYRVITKLSDYIHLVSIPTAGILGILVTADICSRLFFSIGILWSHSLEGLLMLLLAYCSAGVSWREEQFVRIQFFTSRLNERVRLILDVFAILVGLGCCGLLVWLGIENTIVSLGDGSKPMGIDMRLWPWRLILPIGSLVLCAEMLNRLIDKISQLAHRRVVP